MATRDPERYFDRRTITRHLKRGHVTDVEFDGYVEALPDVSDKIKPRDEGGDDDGFDTRGKPKPPASRPLFPPGTSLLAQFGGRPVITHDDDDDDDDDYDDDDLDDDDDDLDDDSAANEATPSAALAEVSAPTPVEAEAEAETSAPIEVEPSGEVAQADSSGDEVVSPPSDELAQVEPKGDAQPD